MKSAPDKVIMPHNSNNGKWFKSKWKSSIKILWESFLRRHRKVWQPQREKEVRCMHVTQVTFCSTFAHNIWKCMNMLSFEQKSCTPLQPTVERQVCSLQKNKDFRHRYWYINVYDFETLSRPWFCSIVDRAYFREAMVVWTWVLTAIDGGKNPFFVEFYIKY